jgi:uncharacterized lipoprotein
VKNALRVKTVLCLAAALPLASCGGLFKASCVKPGDYAGAVNNPPLKVPPGLTAPDARAALPIPQIEAPERERAADEPCLDAPPKYVAPKDSRPAA